MLTFGPWNLCVLNSCRRLFGTLLFSGTVLAGRHLYRNDFLTPANFECVYSHSQEIQSPFSLLLPFASCSLDSFPVSMTSRFALRICHVFLFGCLFDTRTSDVLVSFESSTREMTDRSFGNIWRSKYMLYQHTFCPKTKKYKIGKT